MNRKQWFVFGIGSIILSMYLFSSALGWGSCGLENITDLICNIRKYAHAIPAIIFQFVGWMFIICGFLESKSN